MSEHLNKFDRIRAEIEKKYGDKASVTFNEEKPKLKRKYPIDEFVEIIGSVMKLDIGENVKISFKDFFQARTCCRCIRNYIKKKEINDLRISQQSDDVYLLREKHTRRVKTA